MSVWYTVSKRISLLANTVSTPSGQEWSYSPSVKITNINNANCHISYTWIPSKSGIYKAVFITGSYSSFVVATTEILIGYKYQQRPTCLLWISGLASCRRQSSVGFAFHEGLRDSLAKTGTLLDPITKSGVSLTFVKFNIFAPTHPFIRHTKMLMLMHQILTELCGTTQRLCSNNESTSQGATVKTQLLPSALYQQSRCLYHH